MLGLSAHSASAQADLSNEDLLRDFIHFVKINRNDVADLYGRELITRGLTGAGLVDLVAETGELARFEDAVAQAQRTPALADVGAQLYREYEQGKLQRARSPEEIAEAIEMLSAGTARGRLIARERLVAAGEYAMPQLFDALLAGEPRMQAEIQRLMIDMGRQAVVPLVTALPELPEAAQERLATILGLISSRASIPALVELRASTDSENVREAADRALGRLADGGAVGSASVWYLRLGEEYYTERRDLTSFPGEAVQLLWSYDPGIGLVMTAIDTSVFHEAMAMRAAEDSLRLNANGPEALALWIASNYSREIDSPDGYSNPAYSADRRDAEYYGIAAGTGIAQRVLARGLDNRDTPLIRRAIAAIERTAGGSSLWSGPASAGVSRRPLLEALGYPDRRVRYEAALALGAAQPRETFEGAERVVPILASAVRDADERYAAVLADDAEQYQALRALLTGEGYRVLPQAGRLSDLADALADIPGLDVAVTAQSQARAREAVIQMRANPALSATPVLALLPGGDYTALRRQYERDQTVMLRPNAVTDDQFRASVTQLIDEAAGGPITSDEARVYTRRALSVLRDLAVSESSVLPVGDAVLPLIAVLNEFTGQTRMDVAEVLARIDQQRAQVALMDAALNAESLERLVLMNKVADSAKRFGAMLTDRQVQQIVRMTESDDDTLATASAALFGALGLPNTRVVPLVLSE